MIKAHLSGQMVSSNSTEAFSLFSKSQFGERKEDKVQYSLMEALYLAEKNKMEVYSKNKQIIIKELFKKFQRFDKKLHIKYAVFKDLRNKGYIVKTALKFGAEFRVYDKGSKKGESHAKWIVFTEYESGRMTWHDFSAKNRVAHSTKKNLLIAIVDGEGDITYYEVRWLKP
jgi:tRNA-intron endonuclease